jgi:hypothetical protein
MSYKYGAPALKPGVMTEHFLGSKQYNHAHLPPFGVSLKLPFFHLYPSVMITDRRRLNVFAILMNVVIPWMLFCITLGLFSFSIRYRDYWLCWKIVLSLSLLTVAIPACCLWLDGVKMEVPYEEYEREKGPKWFAALLIMSFLAMFSGKELGDFNFNSRMGMVYDYESLATYHNIDPGNYKGEQLPDVGRITFTNDTYLRLNYSMGFKDTDTYCVVPIVTPRMKHYDDHDFWAVGKNCCDGISDDFHCPGYNDASIHSGLRLLDESSRPFYRLATQQAEARHWINSHRPLFFEWMPDPERHVKTIKSSGLQRYFVGVVVGFIFQCFVVSVLVMIFAKIYPLRDEEMSFGDTL